MADPLCKIWYSWNKKILPHSTQNLKSKLFLMFIWYFFILYIIFLYIFILLYNTCTKTKGKTKSMKDFAISVSKNYLSRANKFGLSMHKTEQQLLPRYCCIKNCIIRTRKFCKTCSLYYRNPCFKKSHDEDWISLLPWNPHNNKNWINKK